MAGPTRRDFIRLVGAGATAASGMIGVASCDDAPDLRDAAAAVLEPASTGFLVAVWARRAKSATVEVRVAGERIRTMDLELIEGGAVLEIDGLSPDGAYEVTVTSDDGIRLGPHRVRTAPTDDTARPVRIGVFADVDVDPEFDSDLVDQLIAAAPDLLVSLGDFPYCDNGPDVAQTVEAYRDRHIEARTLPKVRTLLEAGGLRAIYDDHEFRNNWDAMFVGKEADRYAAAIAVWDEYFPTREQGDVRYRKWRWGADVECFLLDCRRFRSANAAVDDETKTMLGATQRAWFEAAIAASTATWKLVFSSVPLAYGVGVDHWAGFTRERDALFASLVGVPGVLFLSADQHWFAAHRHAYGIREFQVGPLCRGVLTPDPPVEGVLFRAERWNVGLVEIEGRALKMIGLGAGGERFYEETLTPEQLTPR